MLESICYLTRQFESPTRADLSHELHEVCRCPGDRPDGGIPEISAAQRSGHERTERRVRLDDSRTSCWEVDGFAREVRGKAIAHLASGDWAGGIRSNSNSRPFEVGMLGLEAQFVALKSEDHAPTGR
jgi:hypothetical protein